MTRLALLVVLAVVIAVVALWAGQRGATRPVGLAPAVGRAGAR